MSGSTLFGTVLKRCPKTVFVRVEFSYRHAKYKKVVRARKKYVAHDPSSMCEVGQIVKIASSRPYSATKRWIVVLDTGGDT